MKSENKRNADKDKTWNNAEWSTKQSEQCPITLLRARNVFSTTLLLPQLQLQKRRALKRRNI